MILTTEGTERTQKQRFSVRSASSVVHSAIRLYQTRQAGLRTMGASGLQLYAFWNSGMFPTTPLTRNFPGECSLTPAIMRANSGRSFSHQIWPQPTNRQIGRAHG